MAAALLVAAAVEDRSVSFVSLHPLPIDIEKLCSVSNAYIYMTSSGALSEGSGANVWQAREKLTYSLSS